MIEPAESPASKALQTVKIGELCAGCGLCAGVSDGAIEMRVSASGYARPEQIKPLDFEQEAIITHACPGLKVHDWETSDPEAKSHCSWGPYLECLTGHATDSETRFRGSSGGAISALAIHALEQGMANRVVQVFQDDRFPTRNLTHVSSSAEEVLSGSGSRYAPSSPLEDIGRHLDEGVTTIFIGKPCDVSALRRLARLDSRVDRVFPLMLSFFCGGIPSHAGADRILDAMGVDRARLKNFRYRGEGWPGLTVAEDVDGTKATMRYENSWGDFLSKQVQFRCKICPDAVGGVADIVCADAWYGGEAGYPQFEEQDGRSLILARSKRGRELVLNAVRADVLQTEPLPITDIDLMQPAQARRKKRIAARLFAAKVAGKPIPEMRGLDLLRATKEESFATLVKEFLGTIRRIVTKRL